MAKKDYYDVLGVSRNASTEELKKASGKPSSEIKENKEKKSKKK